MSLFGSAATAAAPQGSTFGGFGGTTQQQSSGGLFGNLGQNTQQQQQQQQQTGGLFGSLGQSNQTQPKTGGLFGGLGQSTQQQPQQQSGGLFGSLGQSTQQPQQQSGGLFGSLGQNTQTQQSRAGGIFGGLGQSTQQQPQQQSGGLFGSLGQNTQQNQPQSGGLFGSLGQNVQQQPQQQTGGMSFGYGNLANSQLWQPEAPGQKTVPEQIKMVVGKWHKDSPDSAFQYYFYNKVDEQAAPFYRPAANEDPKAWEEALSKKPGPGYIPVLCRGFQQLGERIKIQQRNLASFNQLLHDINNSLEAMLSRHDLILSVRTLDARRKHAMLKQRCMALATKVQILRNRGYALGGDEEELKNKLAKLERGVCDPGLSARAEEIWARMVGIRERARVMKDEMGKKLGGVDYSLDEVTVQRSEKILEDYAKQLTHLKKELERIQEDFNDWQKDQPPTSKK